MGVYMLHSNLASEEFPHYRLEKFTDEQIDLFIGKWYDSRYKDLEESQRCQASLKKAIEQQAQIHLLARNPLLLTIIALIHRYEAYLPRQRYKLYKSAVDALLIRWDEGKGMEQKWPMQYLNLDDIERLMQRLAYWIHSQGGTADKEGGTLIDIAESIAFSLSQGLLQHQHQESSALENAIDALWNFVVEKE